MKININDVAKKAGVSIATVSRAFNSSNIVRQETRNKILEIAQELNYIPNPIARSLSRQTTDTIGVVLPGLVGEFFMDIIHGIDKEAYRHGKYVIVSSSHSQRNITETLIEFMGSGRVDGVILMAPQMHGELNEIIQKSKRPVVLINACKDLNNVVNFQIDNYEGASISVEHLVKVHDYNRIGFIKGPAGNCDSEERFRGYCDALEKYNLTQDSSLIAEGNFDIDSGYEGFKKLIESNANIDAVFASNDMMALGAYEAAKILKIRIPQDVAVIGFDDIFLSRLITPRLTTVKFPIEEIGAKAVSYLLKMISEKSDLNIPYKEFISTELIIGESCGCTVNTASYIINGLK